MAHKSKISLLSEVQNGKDIIAFRFPYEKELVGYVKMIDGIRWNKEGKYWYLRKEKFDLNTLFTQLRDIAYIAYSAVKDNQNWVDENDRNIQSEVEGKQVQQKLEIIAKESVQEEDNVAVDTLQIKFNKTDKLLYIKTPYIYKEEIKKLAGAQWHSRTKQWIAYANEENSRKIKDNFINKKIKVLITEDDYSLLKKKKDPYKNLKSIPNFHKEEVQEFKKWMIQKRYADSTIKTYESCLTVFFRFYFDKSISEIGLQEVENFNYLFIIKNSYSSKTQNQYISAIKTFFVKMKGIKYELNSIERPIEGIKLPKVIPMVDVQKMLIGIHNTKHKTALTTIYSLGLRRSELLNLKLSDISFKRNTVEIINSKGKKDRVLPLPKKLKV